MSSKLINQSINNVSQSTTTTTTASAMHAFPQANNQSQAQNTDQEATH